MDDGMSFLFAGRTGTDASGSGDSVGAAEPMKLAQSNLNLARESYLRLIEEINAGTSGMDAIAHPVNLAAKAWSSVKSDGFPRPLAERFDLLLLIARTFFLNAEAGQALEPAAMAVDEARLLDDPARLRRALTGISALYTETGNQSAAIESASEGVSLLAPGEDAHMRSKLLNNTGLAHLYAGQFEDAIDCFEVACNLFLRKRWSRRAQFQRVDRSRCLQAEIHPRLPGRQRNAVLALRFLEVERRRRLS